VSKCPGKTSMFEFRIPLEFEPDPETSGAHFDPNDSPYEYKGETSRLPRSRAHARIQRYRKARLASARRCDASQPSPSHQFAPVPCSQPRHILIYPNVLYVDGQFANRANHPIALTLPAIQPTPVSFLLDGSCDRF